MKVFILIGMLCLFSFIVSANVNFYGHSDKNRFTPKAIISNEDTIDLKIAAIDWCPQICSKSENSGYMVDIVNEIFKDSKYKVQIEIFPWSRAIKYVSEGIYYALLAPAKKEAPNLLYPIQPIGSQQMCFFTTKHNKWKYTGVNSLKNQKVGIAQDTSIEELNAIVMSNPENFQFQPYHERFIKQNALKLLKGRIDSFIFTKNTTIYALKELGLNNKIINVGCVTKVPVFFAFSPKKINKVNVDSVISFIDKRLITLEKNGVIHSLYQKYNIK